MASCYILDIFEEALLLPHAPGHKSMLQMHQPYNHLMSLGSKSRALSMCQVHRPLPCSCGSGSWWLRSKQLHPTCLILQAVQASDSKPSGHGEGTAKGPGSQATLPCRHQLASALHDACGPCRAWRRTGSSSFANIPRALHSAQFPWSA